MSVVAKALNEITGRSRNVFNRPGVWPGRVEDINDPKRLNRIRVRVFHLHGDKRSTPTTALPWAELSDFGGGGYDYGSAGNLYPIGSTVWISFILGDDRFPVVIGGRRGATVRDDNNPSEFLTVDGTTYDEVSKSWLPPEGNEIPKDIYDESANGDSLPTRTVWSKSYKGHTILVDDRDGYEFLKIIDRAGQVIELNCPVTADDNKNNKQQRGARNASNDTQLPQSVLVNQKAFIRIKDVGGNEVLLDGSGGNEKITIRSSNRQGTSQQVLVLSSAKGSEQIYFEDKQGNKVLINPTNPTESVVVQDYSGNRIVFNAEAGQLRLKSTTLEVHEAGGVQSDINADRTEVIGGSENTKIAGNKFLDVLNDLAASINGMTSLIAGGAVQVAVANSPASGVPATTALSVDIALGGVSIKSQVCIDPMTFSTLAGNVSVGTLAGNVSVTTLAGLAEFGTESAQTTVKGPLGILLGVPAAFSIPFGEAIQTAFTTVGTTAAADIRFCMGIPVPPTALAGLSAALAPQIAPGVLYSLLNKTQ